MTTNLDSTPSGKHLANSQSFPTGKNIGAMFVGQTATPECQPFLKWCEREFDWLAIRSTPMDAGRRPSHDATALFWYRHDSRTFSASTIETMVKSHQDSAIMEVRGPYCESFFRHVDRRYSGGICFLKNAIPSAEMMLRDSISGSLTDSKSIEKSGATTIAVRANRWSDAEPSLLLAKSLGLHAHWCQKGGESSTNVDEVWWVDPCGQTVDESQLSHLMQSFGRKTIHRAFVSSPVDTSFRNNRLAHFDHVIRMPFLKPSSIGLDRRIDLKTKSLRSPDGDHGVTRTPLPSFPCNTNQGSNRNESVKTGLDDHSKTSPSVGGVSSNKRVA